MDNNIQTILKEARNIAVVGCSGNPGKDAHSVPAFLQMHGYRIIPVNPAHKEILGETCYPNLKSLPDDLPVDIVDIFRPAAETAGIVRQIIKWSYFTSRKPVIWTQLGVSSEEAKKLAYDADLPYIINRCLKVEFLRVESELQAKSKL